MQLIGGKHDQMNSESNVVAATGFLYHHLAWSTMKVVISYVWVYARVCAHAHMCVCSHASIKIGFIHTECNISLCEILAQRGRILPDFFHVELVVWIWRRNPFIVCLLMQTFLSPPPCSSEPSARLSLGALLPSWFLLAEITCLDMAQDMSQEYTPCPLVACIPFF